ncbi:PREDICTED: uncharacterized protein LOC107348197 isoform X2 [Acropora digitifera]|uniref:uncharacterized protein LOC107348197 isoform X2 n=1 Tax=Acropora digitifera TaxID=70779 RepID=UPI00077A32CB|nr:PREDICTED: uncharacterized protein LOC107348197 isoform X2 [Acropora digitifera]
MASATPSSLASSKEKTNGAKLRRLLVDGGTKVFRDIFDSYHPPARLAADLNANYLILDDLLHRRILNRHQWDALFPPGRVPPDSNSFDITLLFLLLTNICGLTCPFSGWHAMPPSSDTSLEANLARLKYFRNVLCHITTTGVNTKTFLRQWKEISGALVDLGFDQAEIDRLKAERCGEKDYLKVLRDWADSEEDIKSQMKELRQTLTETQRTVEEMHQLQLEEHLTLHCSKTKLEELCQAQREDRQLFHESRQTQNMTYEAVGELRKNQTKTGQALENVQADVQEMKQTISCLEGKQKEDTEDEILQELAMSEFKGDIQHHAGRFQEGTREWIFAKVEKWLDNRKTQNRVMVISGNAGMGKTVISAVICQRMQQAGRLSGSHFCQHNNIRYKNPQLMLQSLACNLSHAIPEYKTVLVETLSRNVGRELNNMGVEELFALLFKEPLSSVCDPGHNMLMVIDGLDESEFKGRNELLDVIANHFCKLPVWIRFLVTTRPEQNITEKLKLLKPFLLEPSDEMNVEDIKTLFERRLQPAVKPDNFKSIVSMLVEKSEGLMLYAYFLVLYFEENPSAFHQAKFDDSLPLGISSVYHTYFKRLENELIQELGIKEEKFLNLLCCLCASREPLPIDLVSKVLLPGSDSPIAKRKVLKALSSVSSLLPIRSECLHVIHKSVKDWLTDTSCYGEHDFLMDEKVGHELLGKLCAQELDNLKARGVHKVQFTSAQKYALYHGTRHVLLLDENRRQPKLDELAKKYVLDLELLFARVCVNNSKATEDLLWLHDEGISSLLSEDSRSILRTLMFLLRKYHRRLISHPGVFLQAALNEGGTVLSCVAANLLRSKYPEISCMEYVLKNTQANLVLARFFCSSRVVCLDVSRRLDYMACECADGTLQLWSLETGQLKWTRPVKVAKCFEPIFPLRSQYSHSMYRSVVFHPTENLVLPGILSHGYATDGELKPLFPQSDCIFTVCSISGDMTKMLTDFPHNEKCLVLWSLTDGSEIARFFTDEAVESFAWSPNGRLIAVSFRTRLISLIDATNGFRTLVQKEVPRMRGLIKFSSDQKAVFVSLYDAMKVVSYAMKVVLWRFNINMVDDHSFSLDLSPDDGGGAESHCDCGFLLGDLIPPTWRDFIFDFRLNKETVLKFSPGSTTIEMLNANAAAIKPDVRGITQDLILSLNGDILYVLSGYKSSDCASLIGVWDTSSGNFITEKDVKHMRIIRVVAVTEGVLFECCGLVGNSVELWDSKLAARIYRWTNFGQPKRTIPISETQVAFIQDGRLVNGRFEMKILDTSSRSVVASIALNHGYVVACNSKCQVVTARGHTFQCSDGTSVLWQTDLGLPAYNSDDHCNYRFCGMVSPAEQYLLIWAEPPTSDDCRYVLDACSGTVLNTLLKGRTDVVDYKFISDVECVMLCSKGDFPMKEVRLELHNALSGNVLTVLDLDYALNFFHAAVCPRNRFIAVELLKSSRSSSSNFKVIQAWSSERRVCGNNGRMGETEESNDDRKQMISTRCILH